MGRKTDTQGCPVPSRVRFAALDIGSSAIRYRVVEWSDGGPGHVLESRRFPVSLGESVFRTGRIRKGARQRAEEGLKSFARALDRWQVADYRAVATSAVRESLNGREWTTAVRERFHLDVEILSGEAEARLVHRALEPYREPLDRPGLLADLGGGSLELVAFRGPGIRACDSLPLGTVRSGPLSRRDPFPLAHRLLLEEARESFRRRFPDDARTRPLLVLTGGNAEVIARILREERAAGVPSLVEAAWLRDFTRRVRALKPREIAERWDLTRERAKVLPFAAGLFSTVAETWEVEAVCFPFVGVRDGLIRCLGRRKDGDVRVVRPVTTHPREEFKSWETRKP